MTEPTGIVTRDAIKAILDRNIGIDDDCRPRFITGKRAAVAEIMDHVGWRPIATAPKEPRTGRRGPNIIGMDASGLIGRTSWLHEHYKGSHVWLLYTGEGLMEWEPILWIDDPHPDGRVA